MGAHVEHASHYGAPVIQSPAICKESGQKRKVLHDREHLHVGRDLERLRNQPDPLHLKLTRENGRLSF